MKTKLLILTILSFFCSFVYAQNPDWGEFNVNLYPDNMTVFATISIDGVEQTNSNLVVAPFYGDEICGVPADEPQFLYGRYVYTIAPQGDSNGKIITFRIYDNEKKVEYVAENELSFECNGIVGIDPEDPDPYYVINVDTKPDWGEFENVYDDFITITSVIHIDGVEQANESLIIAPFCENERRGGICTYNQSQSLLETGRYYYLLSAYGEDGDVIYFKIYDTESQIEYVAENKIEWHKGNSHGSSSAPEVIEIITTQEPEYVTQTIQLIEGWNWVSFHVGIEGEEGLEMLLEALGTKAITIKSHTQFTIYYEDYDMWDGDLKTIETGKSYMIKMSEGCSIDLSGLLVDPSEYSFTLKYGWNWLAYPLTTEMRLEDVDFGFTPKDGDYIKSRTQFAIYYADYGLWDGDLTVFEPGEGYQYKSQDLSDKVLTFTLKKEKSIKSINK